MPAYAPDSVLVPSAAPHGFLIDMDGVIYRGSELIPGADRFIGDLIRLGLPFLFLTNNSQRTRRDVVTKLQRLGMTVDESHIYSCAMATARFLATQKPGGTAFVIGEGGLLQALHQNGYSIVDHDPDYVVVGEGRTVTFEMVEQATMETDILGAVQLGYRTILVLSGGTARSDLAAYAYRPDMVVESIGTLSAAELAGVGSRMAD